MQKKLFVAGFFILISFIATPVLAFSLSASIDVPANCTVTDTDGSPHTYTASSATTYIAMCAVKAAMDNGTVSSAEFSNAFPSMGLYLTNLNGVTADPSSQYWAIYKNGILADLGLSSLTITTGDILSIKLHDFSDNDLGDSLTLNINSLITATPTPPPSGGGQSVTSIVWRTEPETPPAPAPAPAPKPIFDSGKAFSFLAANQKTDGGFGDDLYTDWAALALGSTSSFKLNSEALKKNLASRTISGTLPTDSERHTMALLALGLDPYNANGQNYVKKIVDSWDGKQFGDPKEVNDDIFALIVLNNAGYTLNDPSIAEDVNFVLNAEQANGSWNDSVDLSGAAILALEPYKANAAVASAIGKTKSYLESEQKEDGGWGNASSTAWAMEGILALGENPSAWTKNDNSLLQYLGTLQDSDGGIKGDDNNTRVWETAYALSAISGQDWSEIMHKVAREETEPVIAQAPKKEFKKNPPVQTAAVINSLPTPDSNKNQPAQAGWFQNFIHYVFGF